MNFVQMPGGWVAILHFSAFESKFALFQMLCMLFLRLLLKEILREEKEKGTVQLKKKKSIPRLFDSHNPLTIFTLLDGNIYVSSFFSGLLIFLIQKSISQAMNFNLFTLNSFLGFPDSSVG